MSIQGFFAIVRRNLNVCQGLLVRRMLSVALSISIVLSVAGFQSVSAAAVSYLQSPIIAQQVELQPMLSNVDVEEVPYLPLDLSGAAGVLAAQSSRSPISELCKGADVSSGSYVCSTFSTRDEVSDSVQGERFSKFCKIHIVYATYPAFFKGGDFVDIDGDGRPDADGRTDVYQGEWRSFANVTGRTMPDSVYVDGEAVPGASYHMTGASNFGPEDNLPYLIDPKEATETDYHPMVTSSGEVVDDPGSLGADSDSKLAIGPCDESPLETVGEKCESAVKAYSEWFDGSILAPEIGGGLSRPIADAGTCPLVENVNYKIACLNAETALLGWTFSFWGRLMDLGCLLTNTCYEDVQLMIQTDSLMGTNYGCEEPCGDVYSDAIVASQRAPSLTTDCSSDGMGGQNTPCVEDRYVGTPGLCSVCNKLVPCTFVWKNWLYDHWEAQMGESDVCEVGVNAKFCTFEEYFKYVIDHSGGISKNIHPG